MNIKRKTRIVGRPYRGGSTYKGGNCLALETFAIFKLAGIILAVTAITFFYQWLKRQPIPSNETYVKVATSEVEVQDLYPFESGLWASQYYQYNNWHRPHRFSLFFDAERWKVTENGSDDVGTYTIDGLCSTKTNRIGLTKTYQKGTSDWQQNLGHNVTIQVAWNASQHKFEGKWFVRTNKYVGEDKLELKLEKSNRSIQ